MNRFPVRKQNWRRTSLTDNLTLYFSNFSTGRENRKYAEENEM